MLRFIYNYIILPTSKNATKIQYKETYIIALYKKILSNGRNI